MLREFTDAHGSRWRVWDTQPSTGAVRAEFRAGWLTFEQEAPLGRSLRKRLAPIPSGWEQMVEDELRELCTRATPERPRRRLPS